MASFFAFMYESRSKCDLAFTLADRIIVVCRFSLPNVFVVSRCRRPSHRQDKGVFCHHPAMRHTGGPDHVVALMGEDALFTGKSDTNVPFHEHT